MLIEQSHKPEAPPQLRPWHVGHGDLLPLLPYRNPSERRKIDELADELADGNLSKLTRAYQEAYKQVGLENFSFQEASFLDNSYLDVVAESPESALKKAVEKQNLIREYLSLEIRPDKPVYPCHTWIPPQKELSYNLEMLGVVLIWFFTVGRINLTDQVMKKYNYPS